MKTSELLSGISISDELLFLAKSCSDYLKESNGAPLYKVLTPGNDVRKVKLRIRKMRDSLEINNIYEHAFSINKIYNKALFANGKKSTNDDNLYYVFPVNGYKFFYATEIENSSRDAKATLDEMIRESNHDIAEELLTDLMKFIYKSDNLIEAIESGAEVMLYNIQKFYAVKTSSYKKYDELYNKLITRKGT